MHLYRPLHFHTLQLPIDEFQPSDFWFSALRKDHYSGFTIGGLWRSTLWMKYYWEITAWYTKTFRVNWQDHRHVSDKVRSSTETSFLRYCRHFLTFIWREYDVSVLLGVPFQRFYFLCYYIPKQYFTPKMTLIIHCSTFSNTGLQL